MQFEEALNKVVREHPEAFEALMEFERTGKLPKISRRVRIDVTIDQDILRKFKAYCAEKGYNISRLIEKKMIEELSKKS